MTTIEKWIDASLKIMEENCSICREHFQKGNVNLLVEQSKALKKHVDSFIDFLERKSKFE